MITYIIKILQSENSVFVNDLGLFTKHYVPAHIENGIIYPPYYVVELDTSHEEEEMMFVQFVSRECKCRILEAGEAVAHWVNNLKYALEANKSVSYDHFGTFTMNDKGDIVFKCEYVNQLNTEFEGMKPLSLSPEAVDKTKTVAVPEPIAEPEPVPESKMVGEQEPVAEPEPVVEPEPIAKPEPVAEPEPIAESEPVSESKMVGEQEPVVELEPVVEPEPIAEPEPVPESKMGGEQELIVEPEPVVEPEPIVEPEPVPESKMIGEQEPVVEPEPVIEQEPVVEPEPVKKKHRKAWIWIIVVLIIIALAVVCYIFWTPISETVHKWIGEKPQTEQVVTEEETQEISSWSDEMDLIDSTTVDSLDIENSSMIEGTEDVESVSEAEAVQTSVPNQSTTYKPDKIKTSADGKYSYVRFQKGYYYVIAGSFQSEQSLLSLVKQRHLEQYNPTFVVQDGTAQVRVCIGVFDSETAAFNYAKDQNQKYWVLK